MKKNLILAFAAGTVALSASGAFAASTDVDASVNISQTAVEISTTRGLDFGSFEITNAAASGTITVDTTNTLSTAASGIVHAGDGNSGLVNVSGTPGSAVELSCSSTATLFHAVEAGQSLNVSGVALEGHVCSTGVASAVLDQTGNLNWNVGGTLEFDSPRVGAYSTANAGGQPITVDVVYQ